MNREVFLSILAMDAYQRGYAPGINRVSPAVSKDGLIPAVTCPNPLSSSPRMRGPISRARNLRKPIGQEMGSRIRGNDESKVSTSGLTSPLT